MEYLSVRTATIVGGIVGGCIGMFYAKKKYSEQVEERTRLLKQIDGDLRDIISISDDEAKRELEAEPTRATYEKHITTAIEKAAAAKKNLKKIEFGDEFRFANFIDQSSIFDRFPYNKVILLNPVADGVIRRAQLLSDYVREKRNEYKETIKTCLFPFDQVVYHGEGVTCHFKKTYKEELYSAFRPEQIENLDGNIFVDGVLTKQEFRDGFYSIENIKSLRDDDFRKEKLIEFQEDLKQRVIEKLNNCCLLPFSEIIFEGVSVGSSIIEQGYTGEAGWGNYQCFFREDYKELLEKYFTREELENIEKISGGTVTKKEIERGWYSRSYPQVVELINGPPDRADRREHFFQYLTSDKVIWL